MQVSWTLSQSPAVTVCAVRPLWGLAYHQLPHMCVSGGKASAGLGAASSCPSCGHPPFRSPP